MIITTTDLFYKRELTKHQQWAWKLVVRSTDSNNNIKGCVQKHVIWVRALKKFFFKSFAWLRLLYLPLVGVQLTQISTFFFLPKWPSFLHTSSTAPFHLLLYFFGSSSDKDGFCYVTTQWSGWASRCGRCRSSDFIKSRHFTGLLEMQLNSSCATTRTSWWSHQLTVSQP